MDLMLMFKTPSATLLCLFYRKCRDAHFELYCYNTNPTESVLSGKFTFYIPTRYK